MKQIFLIPCIFFALLSTANTQEIFKCVDSHGNTVFTSSPQDGMKCATGKSDNDNEPKGSRKQPKTNLVDICSDLSRELEGISDEIAALEKRRFELQKEYLDIRQNESPNDWTQRRRWESTKPGHDKMYKLNQELSMLFQKKSLIQQDTRLNKCNELNNDLSRLNQKSPEVNRSQRYNRRRTTIIVR